MSNQRPLALRCPLRGSRLIEASAGTGKTFTISALYLRLVLGHGEGDSAFSRELLPPDVLVELMRTAFDLNMVCRVGKRPDFRFSRDKILQYIEQNERADMGSAARLGKEDMQAIATRSGKGWEGLTQPTSHAEHVVAG